MTYLVFYRLCMAPFCPGSTLHTHPAPVLVKGQEESICPGKLVLEKRARFTNEVCRGFRYHTAYSIVFFACNA